MGIAKNKGPLTGNLVKICSGKMKRHYPKETNPVNANEFTWTRPRMKGKKLAAHLFHIIVCSLFAHLFR